MPRRWEGTLRGCVGAPGLEPQPASKPRGRGGLGSRVRNGRTFEPRSSAPGKVGTLGSRNLRAGL